MPEATPLRLLLVEDVEDDATLILRELRRHNYAVECERVEDAPAMREALKRRLWDLVLSDWAMPQFNALAAVALLNDTTLDIPLIIVSGTVGEDVAVRALQAGAHDFVLKGNLSRLVPAVERELRESESRRARRQAEADLRESESRYRMLFDSSPLPMWVYEKSTHSFLAVNDATIEHYGYSREEFAGLTVDDIRAPADVAAGGADIDGPLEPRRVWHHRKKDGSIIAVEIKAHDVEFERARARLVLVNDVTERLRVEDQLRQSQKMDAIGRLAGGVAHDFNNLLSVILSYGEMLLAEMKPGERMREDVQEIHNAGKRAATLTRQLLLFSRQQVSEPRVVDLNELLVSMDRMLQRILGADVALLSTPTQPLGKVRVDPGNIEQVIMNLVVNARDAMPRGGKLTMETSNVVLDEAYAKAHLGVTPGPHVMLAVTDSGTGIDKTTLSRIFEPFFTTKERGKGTGLGLSTVFGIVQQSGGTVWVYSELGTGTTFKIYLPRVDAIATTRHSSEPPASLRGSETVLLVEDDDAVRAVARDILGKNGYHVIEAGNAGEALLRAEEFAGTIHLLLTDVVMPQVSGPELAKRLTEIRPDMKVLCMSGYTDDSIVRHGVVDAKIAYLQKPLTPRSLATKVREVLDATDR